MTPHPPKWADRFLSWYCNPDLLEEIQGDAHELYCERLSTEGKAAADRKYIWDVLRFCRWSNIRRTSDQYRPGYLGILWNLNAKIALRNAFRNKLVFTVKMFGVSICLAFALLVTAFTIHEFTFDEHYADHERIFRVGSSIEIEGVTTNYAVSPVALADGLAEEIPEIEQTCWLMYANKPVYGIEDRVFSNEITFTSSENFLKIFNFEFIQGTPEAMQQPNAIVLTETTAEKFFGDKDPMGEVVSIGWTDLEVTAIIRDLPTNSHLQFSALISHHTFEINEGWENVNSYTYVKLRNESSIKAVAPKIAAVLSGHHDDMVSGREQWSGNEISVSPIIENVAAIHLGEYLEEDIAQKRNRVNLYILGAVVILFFMTGLINFLNLSLAELTTNLKKISILQVFGGSTADHHKVIVTNTVISTLIVIPLSAVAVAMGAVLAGSLQVFTIDFDIFRSSLFISAAGFFIVLFILSSRLNLFVLSRANNIIQSLKGQLSPRQEGFRLREFLVSVQLSFAIIMVALIAIFVDQFEYINQRDKGIEGQNTIVVKLRDSSLSDAEGFLNAVHGLHGVRKADVSSYYLDNVETKEFFEVDTDHGASKMLVAYMNCGHEYFDAMGIRLVAGRNFDPDHNDDKTTFIINETAAREFGWSDPIGKEIRGPLGADRDAGEVIGVVKDFHFTSLHKKIEPLIIFLVNEDWGARHAYVKLNPIHPTNIISAIEEEYKKVYTDLPFEWEYLDMKFDSLYQNDYEIRDVFKAGLLISILVSSLGVFSISALQMAMRQREMGIRKVVGASNVQLFSQHLQSFLKFMVVALIIAWPSIYYLSNYWLEGFAYHIPLASKHFLLPGVSALVIILLTCGYHGVKASRVNPVEILKHE